LAILNATTEIRGNRARLHTGPKFALYGQRWRRVDELLSLERDGYAYVVRLGDQWISLRPDAASTTALALATKHDVLTATHFGPVLDPAVCPDSLAFDLDFSSGVRVSGDGLEFPGVEALQCGLFFEGWKQRLGADCSIDLPARRVDLDLAKAKAYAQAAGLGEINLDPETVRLTGGDMAVRLYTCEGDVGQWAVIQSADEANWQGTGIATRVRDDCFTAIDRSLLEFATSGYEAPLEARLYLHDADAEPTEIRLANSTGITGELTEADNYSDILDAMGSHPIGTDWQSAPEEGAGWIKSPDIVAAGEWPAGQDLHLCIIDPWDVPTPPTQARYHGYDLTGDDAAFLEITMPETAVPGGTSTSTSTARGHRR